MSLTRAACCMLCVTITIVYSFFSSWIKSSILLVEIGSRAEVGSSISRMEGEMANARAIQRRCCWPPERAKAESFSLSLTSSQRTTCFKLLLELIAGLFVRREVHKGELLISEKDIARDIVFVEKGLLRQFYFKEGRDITENFACDGDGAMCIVSLFTGRRNCLQLESLEEGVIWSISYAGLVELSERYLHIARLLRHLLEGSLMLSQYKADSWRFETSRERYARFVRDYPEIARRASVNHIASYLLMTPESLSRVRAGVL